MFVAGIILVSVGTFFSLVGITGGEVGTTLFVLSLIYLTIPGIVFLIVGSKIRRNKIERQSNILDLSNNKTKQDYFYVCPTCNYQLFEDYKCCPLCGTKVTFDFESKFCAECGKELEESFKCCPYCGKQR